jgi:hypothetical protein
VLTGFLCASVSLPASAGTILFDEDVNPGVIFGAGNANGSFTVDRHNGVELGLRGKLRHNASGAPENTFNSNGDGTYSFNAGVAPTQSFPTAEWSFEWSINTNWDNSTNSNLADLTYELGLDSDPTSLTNFTVFDPINDTNPGLGRVQWDHTIGDGSSVSKIPNNEDKAAEYSDLINNNNIAQQSWKPHWFFSGFDPTVDGTYNFYLAAFDGGTELARTEIQIIAGAGGAVVPEPGTLLSFAVIGLLGCGPLARRRRG